VKEFIVSNMQMLLMGATLLASLGYAASGIFRYDADDGERSTGYSWRTGRRALVGLGVGILLAATFPVVPAGHRGVVFDLGSGIQEQVKDEGLTTIIPFWQNVQNMNVRTQVYEYESFVQTLDLQEVTLPIAVNYKVIPDQANELYQEVGQSYVETIIAPAAFQASTEAAGKIEAAAIAQSRAELAQSIGRILAPQLAAHGIFVEFVSVKDAVFDTDFIAAIKAKVIAEQKAEESLRLVQVATNNAESVRRTASGDADALAFLGAGEGTAISEVSSALGFTTEEYLLWQRLQQWNGKLPDVVLGGGQDVIVSIP
jgi:regulator of protease activity HflC (stomatin/prohibitin superfamily)